MKNSPRQFSRIAVQYASSGQRGQRDGGYPEFHREVHDYLASLHREIAPLVNPVLNEETAVTDPVSHLPIYHYWWLGEDQAFLQVDTREPQIALATIPIVVSSEKNITPEQVEAMRNLALETPFSGYCHTGRRNTRWSFLYVNPPSLAPNVAQQIANLLLAMHKIEMTDFPRTHTGRFR